MNKNINNHILCDIDEENDDKLKKIIEDIGGTEGLVSLMGSMPLPQEVRSWINLQDRCIYITDVDETLIEVNKQIILWNKMDKNIPIKERKPIKLLIFSHGGYLQETMALVDLIEISKTPVYTINTGQALSAGLVILLAGHKRFAMKNSTCLIHQGSAAFEGTAEEIAQAQNNYRRSLEVMKEFILRKTKITRDVYKQKSKSEWYITGSNEQIKRGIVDFEITDIDQLYNL